MSVVFFIYEMVSIKITKWHGTKISSFFAMTKILQIKIFSKYITFKKLSKSESVIVKFKSKVGKYFLIKKGKISAGLKAFRWVTCSSWPKCSNFFRIFFSIFFFITIGAGHTHTHTHYTRLYSFKFSCKIVSFTAAKTKRMFSVSETKKIFKNIKNNFL